MSYKRTAEEQNLHEKGLRLCRKCNVIRPLYDFYNYEKRGVLYKRYTCRICNLLDIKNKKNGGV